MMDKNKGFLHCRGKDIVDGDGNRFQALVWAGRYILS